MENDVVLSRTEVLVRFMVYPRIDRQNAVPMGRDIWMSFDTAVGPKFQLGTEHDLTAEDGRHESGRYVVAMVPFLRRVSHPANPLEPVSLITIYFADAQLWPLFPALTPEELSSTRMLWHFSI